MDYEVASIFMTLMPLMMGILVELMERRPSRGETGPPSESPEGHGESVEARD